MTGEQIRNEPCILLPRETFLTTFSMAEVAAELRGSACDGTIGSQSADRSALRYPSTYISSLHLGRHWVSCDGSGNSPRGTKLSYLG